MACNHQCQSRCTRINYDKPLMIREVKRFVAEKMAEAASGVPAAQTGKRAAVIGAGPAGLSCARFLAAQGVEVHLYEEKPGRGGEGRDPPLPPDRRQPAPRHRRHPQAGRAAP